jgi:hypothetical protein
MEHDQRVLLLCEVANQSEIDNKLNPEILVNHIDEPDIEGKLESTIKNVEITNTAAEVDVSRGTEFHKKCQEIQDKDTFIQSDKIKRNSSCNLEEEEGILDNVFTVNEETKDPRTVSAKQKLTEEDIHEFISEDQMKIIKQSFSLFAGSDSGFISCSEVGDFTRSFGGAFRITGSEENRNTGTLYLQVLLQQMKR